MDRGCPSCGAERSDAAGVPCIPLGTVFSLLGGLALVTAFFMPWFATQGLLLSGAFLARFLGSADDVRRFMPGIAGGQAEILLLRALVYLFPASGGVAAVLVILGTVWRGWQARLGIILIVSGLVPLIALVVGMTRLPPGASPEIGLWQLGIGSVAILIGPWLNGWLVRRPGTSPG
jgi:hypothetical protein